MSFKTQCDFVKENPNGLDCLKNPHNFSSNPGFIDKAKEVLGAVKKDLSERVEKVRTAYQTGSQQADSLGTELHERAKMNELGRQALQPTEPLADKPK